MKPRRGPEGGGVMYSLTTTDYTLKSGTQICSIEQLSSTKKIPHQVHAYYYHGPSG